MIVIEYTGNDPYFNLAAEEFLFRTTEPEPVFRLWQNDRAVIIGRHQDPRREVDLAYVEQNDIAVVRRITGGGAVYHDLGNLNFTFSVPTATRDGGIAVRSAFDFSAFTEPVARALRNMGADAKTQGRNDIAISGQKVSGNAQLVTPARTLHHGTLLFSSNLSVIERCLVVPAAKLKTKSVPSVSARVTNIAPHLHEKMNLQTFRLHLLTELEKAFGSFEARSFSQEEQKAIARLADEKYRTAAWNLGNWREGAAFCRAKRIEGCGMVRIDAEIRNGALSGVRFSGDFFASEKLHELERRLEGVKHSPAAIQKTLADIQTADYIRGFCTEQLVSLLLRA